jgi:DNA-binding LytR/AlgR family response regulator
VDYLLKPVEMGRLRATITRVLERLEQADFAASQPERMRAAAAAYTAATGGAPLRRIPVRKKEHIVLLPVEQICTIVADGEILHITTAAGERCHITFRLKDVETRLDADQFVRLSRGTLVNIGMIQRVTPEPGGTYTIAMVNGQELHVSRIRSRIIREQLLRL